jgi:hypothetical protein
MVGTFTGELSDETLSATRCATGKAFDAVVAVFTFRLLFATADATFVTVFVTVAVFVFVVNDPVVVEFDTVLTTVFTT